MRKYKTTDGYTVYKVKKGQISYDLADKFEYQRAIDALLKTIEDIQYDSVLFIFGIDTGSYLKALSEKLCSKNKVIIFEPNTEIYSKYSGIIEKNIQLVLYDPQQIKIIFNEMINSMNFNNLYFHGFGNYSKVYPEEYAYIVERLDWSYINACSQLGLAHRFKKVFIQNMLANLKILNQCTPIHHYIATNKKIPALIVSAGPSLDQNIKDMLVNKEKLKSYFIISGGRTVGALIKNGIMPDMIVSVDPVDANYEMMKDYLELNVPLVFYEYSNRYLVREYKGEKIYIASLFSKTIESLEVLKGVYFGGSVAHSCVDIANMLGCSPILFIGQDLGYTYDKHHSDTAIYDYDKTLDYTANTMVKDIRGNLIRTTSTLNHFKKKLEEYIEIYNQISTVEFVNCSYGAAIQGAAHKELLQVFEEDVFNMPKSPCYAQKSIDINSLEIIESIMVYLDRYSIKAQQGLELCEQIISQGENKCLVDVAEDDIDLQKILYIVQIVRTFENDIKTQYLGGYISCFKYDIKEKAFKMSAKEYDKLTSDLQHQATAFKSYFQEMLIMLEEVQQLAVEIVTEFYK